MIPQHPAVPLRPASTSLASAVHQALLCPSLGLAVIHPGQAAEQPAAVRQIDVQGGTLDQALSQLSRATGLNIAFDQQLLAGKRSPGLQGRFTPDAALQQLLAGSDLRAEPQPAGGYVLLAVVQGAALQLGATNISANGLGSTTQGTRSYTTGSTNTATRLPMSLR